ncbi:hypothetical protein GGR57DRAFT_505847 [Xylariaceae sp. FL1272]|nr:hypothetical protein GGR57DRAFT_505847 [Xylariaceae sp. FL1272]
MRASTLAVAAASVGTAFAIDGQVLQWNSETDLVFTFTAPDGYATGAPGFNVTCTSILFDLDTYEDTPYCTNNDGSASGVAEGGVMTITYSNDGNWVGYWHYYYPVPTERWLVTGRGYYSGEPGVINFGVGAPITVDH